MASDFTQRFAHKHVRIGDPTRFGVLDAIACLVVAFFIGAILALGSL